MDRWLLLLCFPVFLFLACAGAQRGGPASPGPARIKDSAPEKIAAQRAGDRNLDAEAEERRWGFEAARERRRLADEERRRARREPSGPVDVQGAPRAAPFGPAGPR
jgi:hypothetical protein